MINRWRDDGPDRLAENTAPDAVTATAPTAPAEGAKPAATAPVMAPTAPATRLEATGQDFGLSPWDPGDLDGVVGYTMYDLPNSEDGTVTVLLPRDTIPLSPSQSLVRIVSGDERAYLGVVVAGPFAEPDGLRGDASLIVTTSVRSQPFQPQYHGRIKVELLGEEVNGVLQAPRFRPLPSSRVSVLDDAETARVLQVDGDIRLGRAIGHDDVPVGLPSTSKNILPRHLGIVGTTGGGKSTTVAGLLGEAQRAGLAVVLLDVEGEYTHVHEPTTDNNMIQLLALDKRAPAGIDDTHLFHLVGRDTTNEDHPRTTPFSLRFSDLSPHTVTEILDLSEAQQERYFQAWELARSLVAERRIPLPTGLITDVAELDEFETGCPGVTLNVMAEIVGAFIGIVDKTEVRFTEAPLRDIEGLLKGRMQERKPSSSVSWKALRGRLSRLQRLRVFDRPGDGGRPLDLDRLLQPGRVNIFDLSDLDGTDLRNIVIADLLRGIQAAQERRYERWEDGDGDGPPRTLVVVEEAHEFLARNRVARMPVLFGQVERIAKRGRKRWLGLAFVTQLPQHLAPQVSALINNWVIHKVADPAAVSELRQSVSGIDDSLWKTVRGLAPGQAVISCGHMTRPVLTAIHPTSAQLRMVD